MSSHSISIVPVVSNFPNKSEKKDEIVNWLISSDIIKPVLSDCILDMEKLGYAVSQGAEFVTRYPEDLPFDLISNGLEIIMEREIFSTFQNGIDTLICPTCNKNISDEDWTFFNEWASGQSNNLTCPNCKIGSEIHEFKCEPSWGFSDFGFTFWNWPEFKDEFINQFQQRLGCRVDVVYAHI